MTMYKLTCHYNNDLEESYCYTNIFTELNIDNDVIDKCILESYNISDKS